MFIFLMSVTVIVVIIIWITTNNNYFLFAQKPQSKKTPKPPTWSKIQSGLKYLTHNPNKPVPNKYQKLVDAGYLTTKYGKWTSNPTPGGKPQAIGYKPPSGGGKPPSGGKLSGGLANQAWDDYNNKYSNKTTVGNANVVMTDTRNNQFNSEPKKVEEYNKQLVAQGKIPMAYMNTGLVDTPGQSGGDKYFNTLYKNLKAAGVVSDKTNSEWNEPILDGKKILNDPSALNKVKSAYTEFIQGMKSLGYKAINVDNLDFYNQGPNSKLSKSEQQKLGQMWQSTVADLIHQQGMYAVAKNAPDLVTMPGSTYVQKWDGIVTENAKTKEWDDTQAYKKFADAGKPVWNFQTKTNYSNQDLPNWMDSYAVGQGNQGWWEM